MTALGARPDDGPEDRPDGRPDDGPDGGPAVLPGAGSAARAAARAWPARAGWAAAGSRVSGWLWYDRTLQWQLLAAFVLINLVTGAAAGAVIIYNAHDATAVEVAASMEVAKQIVHRTAEQLARESLEASAPEGRALHVLEGLLLRLPRLRHVRIAIVDADGRPQSQRQADEAGAHRMHGPPQWFSALAQLAPLRHEEAVTIDGSRIGTVVLTSQPADEIAEVWHDVSRLAVVVLLANIAVIGLFYMALGRALGPLSRLAAGMRELELGRFGHRLERPRARELADIVDRFNALAGALEAARADNARLNRRLLTVQDDERREIATELHDELGACLFGLRANVLSVQRLADSLPPAAGDLLRRRAETLVEVSERIQTTNRRLLRRLRPMALGHAPLADVLADLVADFERNDADHAFKLDIGRLRHGYGDCVDLTVYRCIQEGLTNAARHAAASTVAIRIDERPAPAPGTTAPGAPSGAAVLRLSVRDDGRGVAPGAPPGLGLTGMERRVSVLGGTFAIAERPTGGTSLDIAIPVTEAEPYPAFPMAMQDEDARS